MCYLGIEHEITDKIVLTYQCRGILTEIMEYFHDLMRFHYLSKSIVKRINRLQINNEAFVCVIHLNELHWPIFRQAFTINS